MADDIAAPAGDGNTTVLGAETAAATAPAADVAPPAEEKRAPEAAPATTEAPKTEAAPVDAAKTETAPEAKEESAKPSWPEDGFPDDWRERTIKTLGLEGDALKRAQERAKRASSPAELLRTVLAGDAKIADMAAELKSAVKIPGDKAKPEEIEAFQKAWGVPEAPDKYDLKALGELSPVDREIWDEVLPEFHKRHYSQEQLNAAAQALAKANEIAAKRMQERAEQVAAKTRDDLLVEYGSTKELNANMELANRYLGAILGKHMDGEARNAFLRMQLADGTSIGAHPGFVRAIVDAARQWAGDSIPDIGENGAGFDIDARVREITAKSQSTNPAEKAEYVRLQPELERLVAAQLRRNQNSKRAGK